MSPPPAAAPKVESQKEFREFQFLEEKDVDLKPAGVSVHAHPAIHPHSAIHPYLCSGRPDGWTSLALKTANGKSNSLLVYGECSVIIGW